MMILMSTELTGIIFSILLIYVVGALLIICVGDEN